VRDLALLLTMLPLCALAVARPFVGVLLWSWISFMNPHRAAWGFASELPWAVAIFGVTVVGCVVAREPKRFRPNTAMVLMVLLILGITATSAVALAPAGVVWDKWDRTFKILLGALLTAALLTDRRRIDALIWVMVISIGYFGVRGGVFTLATGGSYIVLGPPQTSITDRNALAVALLVVVPLMNYLRLQSVHRIVRIGLAVAMGFSLLAAIGSQSRGALVGLVATAGVMWLRSSGKLASGVVLVAVVATIIAFMPDSWVQRMNTIQEYGADESAVGRLTIWVTSYKLAAMRPLVGGGFIAQQFPEVVDLVTPGTFARAAHSIWFEVLGEHGFPTTLVWLGIMVCGVAYSIRIARVAKGQPALRWAYDLARMAQVALVAFVVGGSFLSIAYWDFYFTLIVLLGAAWRVVAESAPQAAASSFARAGWAMRGVAQAAGPPVPAARGVANR
jgi:probable O-glycosylation ligase (exosortase A-associated)